MSERPNLEHILELTPEMLEHISGGVMTERAELVLNALIKALKKDTAAEHTPEEMIEFVTGHLMENINLANVTDQDVKAYVMANWDQIRTE